MTVIVMHLWKINIDKSTRLAFSGENNTEDLYIVLSALEDYTYTLDVQNGSDIGVIPLEKATWNNRDALHVLLTSGQIGAAGTVKLQVVGRNSEGELVKKSNIFSAIVGKSINAASRFADMPESAFEDYLTKTGENADSAKESAEAAAQSESNAKASEEASAASEQNAKASEEASARSETNAKESEEAALESAKSAALSEGNAEGYAKSARESADNAGTSESSATKLYDELTEWGLSVVNGKLCVTYTEEGADG